MNLDEPGNYLNSITRLMNLNLMCQNINKILETKFGLSMVQWSLLKTLLNMPAVSPLVLAKALQVTPGTLTQTLNRLDRKKYLFMCNDPTDARKKMISITKLGKDTLSSIDEIFKRIFSEINLVDSEIEKIDNYLRQKVKSRILSPDILATDENQKFKLKDEIL